MARGRMISKSLSTSERYAALYDSAGDLAEFCQVLYPLLLAHTDDWGVVPGDPFTVKHLVNPTSPRTLPDFRAALVALHNVDLITWYLHEDKWWIYIVGFGAHQNLHGNERRPRTSPPPPENPGIFDDSATNRYDSLQVALREEKRTEGKRSEGKRSEEKGSEEKRTEEKRTEEKAPTLRAVASGALATRGARGAGNRGGLMAGTLPGDHLNCRGPCDRVCLTQKQFSLFMQNHGGDEDTAERFVSAWVAQKRAELPPGPLGVGKPWDFWQALWATDFADPSAGISKLTKALRQSDAWMRESGP